MKALGTLHPAWIAAALALAVALWLGSGLLAGGDPRGAGNAESTSDEAGPVTVQVRTSTAEPIMRTAKLAGRTAPVRSVTLRAQIPGQVVEVVAERGDRVAAGDVIVRLAVEDRNEQLAKAQAMLDQRRLQSAAAEKMAAKGYQTAVGVATAKANLAAARAEVARIRTAIDHSTITAPFAGVLETLPVEKGDYVGVGDPVGQVIQQDPFIVWGNASEDVVPYLEEGQSGSAILIAGKKRQGSLRFIASVADEATRTYRVELEIDNPDGELIAGASAELRLPLERVPAHKVEPAILTLNAQGVFGIKSVAPDTTVRFHPAQIARNQNGHIWLTGLPETLRIITVGQGFVRPGDAVAIAAEEPGATASVRP